MISILLQSDCYQPFFLRLLPADQTQESTCRLLALPFTDASASFQQLLLNRRHSPAVHQLQPLHLSFVIAMADDKKPIHGQSSLCDHLLRSVSSSSVPLRIGLSSITNAGSGLFVGEKVPAGTEIFRSEPLLLVCDDRNKGTCDYCFRDNNSLVHPDGHFFNPGEREDIKTLACTRCKCAQYCSKVRTALRPRPPPFIVHKKKIKK